MQAWMLPGLLTALMVWLPLSSAANPEGAAAQTLSPEEAIQHIRWLEREMLGILEDELDGEDSAA